MERYTVKDVHGEILIFDNEEERIVCISEAATLLNDLISTEEKKHFKEFVKGCDNKLDYDLLDKTLEMLMTPIMDVDLEELVAVVNSLSEEGKANWACANLLRRAVYLKALSDVGEE